MVLADGVAIAVGAVLHKRLPEHFLHRLASVLFLLFGLWMLFDGALGCAGPRVGVTGSVALSRWSRYPAHPYAHRVRLCWGRHAASTTPASLSTALRLRSDADAGHGGFAR